MSDPPRTTTFLLRMWLPDRPGALGAVASRVGSVGGDIVAVDVVDREGGQAVDDLVVELPEDRLSLMLREVRTVDGVGVEEVHAIGQAPPDLGLGVLRAAADLLATTDEQAVGDCLCEHVRQVVRLDWAAVCHTEVGGTLSTVGPTPPASWLEAYALGMRPVDGPPGRFGDTPVLVDTGVDLHAGNADGVDAAPSGVVTSADPPGSSDPQPNEAPGSVDARAGAAERQIAVAPMVDFDLLLLAGREGLSIRPRERALLGALVDVAVARLRDLTPVSPVSR